MEWKQKALEYAKAKIWIDDIEYQFSKSIDIAINGIFEKMLDPELIAKYGKTQEQRMAINSYIRFVKEWIDRENKQEVDVNAKS